ncbi:MAG: peptide ABC transporter substrate-binding protein [Bulleidia sp.]
MELKKPLAIAMAGTMLVGCGSSTTGGGSTAGTGSSSVTVAIDADLNTMDYEYATDGNSFIMQSMCVSGLAMLDSDGQPVPDMAESWEVSDDGMTYTFKIREGAKWSNGTPVTAHDFVYGWQRLVDPALASEYNFIVSTIGVVNADECITGEKPLSDLGVEATDDSTFVVHLTQPCGFLLGLMAFPSFFPLNQEFYESKGDQFGIGSVDDLIYCGPYTMTDWQAGNQYTFTKNEDYWAADKVEVENVTFKFLQDTQSAMLEFQQGNIDVVKLASEQVDAYKEEDGFTTRLEGYGWRLDFCFDVDKLNNVDLRKALSLAIDRTSIADDVLKDGSVPAEGFIPKEFAYGPDGKDYRETAGNLLNATAEPEEAQAYYAKAVAALGGDVTIELLYEDSESCKAVAENLQQQLQTNLPGLTVTMNCKPKKTRLELSRAHEYEVMLTRWGPDYADPQTFMDLFRSSVPGYNGSYFNTDYDALCDKAFIGEDAPDAEKRWADIVEAEKMLIDDMAMIPVYQSGGAMMINPAVSGIEFHAGGVDSYRFMKKAA